MNKGLVSLMVILMAFPWQEAHAQQNSGAAFFWISFADKEGSPFDINQPEAFLSARALERRQRAGIPVTEEDLPVSPRYLQRLKEAGAQVRHTSRWLNGATAVMDPGKVEELKDLPFIRSISYTGKLQDAGNREQGIPFQLDSLIKTDTLYYGVTNSVIKQLNADSLHLLGYTGAGVSIAVLDGGFINLDVNPLFRDMLDRQSTDHFFDFVDADTKVFESSGHGTQVMSLMAANMPGIMVGVAPDAHYTCIKTEDVRGEYRLEECNWVAGLEYADSLGADVVNSSLGYTTFSDTEMDYSYHSLNGKTSMASQAADMAFARGMIVVSSAGNEGNSRWRHIGVPADAQTVLAVGAVFPDGRRAPFSSVGPTADGRVKPDIAAPGVRVPAASIRGLYPTRASGTSLSAPLVAGLIADLWQAFPEKTNAEIIAAVKASADRSENPDNELGYGVPDFMKAFRILAADR